MKWALLLPKARTVIVYLHPAWEISKKDSQHRRPQLHIHLLVSFTQATAVLQMLFFFFPPRFFFSQSELKGEEGSSLTKRSSLCQRPDVFVMYDKAPLRNMIALVKRTNYSPLTTFQTHFYWSIQPNKTLLHWQKGMPSFLHIFSKPRVYMIPVITPL